MPANTKSCDAAISAVVGAILMLAVTVVLGATVYAAVNGFGGDTVEAADAAFKAASVDTNGDGRTDAIKVTYLTGPSDVPAADVTVSVQSIDGTAVSGTHSGAWSPGDFDLFDTPTCATSNDCAYFVSVSILENTVVDQTVTVNG